MVNTTCVCAYAEMINVGTVNSMVYSRKEITVARPSVFLKGSSNCAKQYSQPASLVANLIITI